MSRRSLPFSLPESFGNIKSLQKLSFNNCGRIEDPSAALGKLPALLYLETISGYLTELPESVGEIKTLKELRCLADIKEIPDFIKPLPLETLKIRSNKLRIIPEWIGEMTGLKGLYVKNAPITILSSSLSRLTSP
jgi:Leucine-rich repeat (LRR) protein